MKGGFTATDNYLDRPYRTRRWLVIVAMVVAIGLVIFVNISDQELRGESVLIALVGATGATYLGSKISDNITKDKLNDVSGDI